MGKPVKAIKWANGMLMVFDDKGKQVPDYQGEAKEMLPKLLKNHPNVVVENQSWRK